MNVLTVKFIDKDYYFPQDVLTYIDLLSFTDSVQRQLVISFISKLENEIAKDNVLPVVAKMGTLSTLLSIFGGLGLSMLILKIHNSMEQ